MATTMPRSLPASAVVLAVLIAFGCSKDECPTGAASCDGSIASTCVGHVDNELSGHNEWSRHDCIGKQCVVAATTYGHEAFCAFAATTDPRCPAANDGESWGRCDATKLLSCRDGFLVGETTCATPSVCVDSASAFGGDPECARDAFCAATANPDPLCGHDVVSACDGDSIVTCHCGVKYDAHPCVSPGPRCVLLLTVDGGTKQVAGCR